MTRVTRHLRVDADRSHDMIAWTPPSRRGQDTGRSCPVPPGQSHQQAADLGWLSLVGNAFPVAAAGLPANVSRFAVGGLGGRPTALDDPLGCWSGSPAPLSRVCFRFTGLRR
jgi:hypothetical protein